MAHKAWAQLFEDAYCGAFDEQDPSSMRLFAGCGIVAGSDPDSEVAESDAKLVPMRDALTAG